MSHEELDVEVKNEAEKGLKTSPSATSSKSKKAKPAEVVEAEVVQTSELISDAQYKATLADYSKFQEVAYYFGRKLEYLKINYLQVAETLAGLQGNTYLAGTKWKDVYGWAEEVHGLKKTFVYNLIQISKAVVANKIKAEKYSISQLTELVPVIDSPEAIQAAEGKTVKEIREIKKAVLRDVDLFKYLEKKVEQVIEELKDLFDFPVEITTRLLNGTSSKYEIEIHSEYRKKKLSLDAEIQPSEKGEFLFSYSYYNYDKNLFFEKIKGLIRDFKNGVDSKLSDKGKAAPKAPASAHGLTNDNKRLDFARNLANWTKLKFDSDEFEIYQFNAFPEYIGLKTGNSDDRLEWIFNNKAKQLRESSEAEIICQMRDAHY